jgi:hypothetical protein
MRFVAVIAVMVMIMVVVVVVLMREENVCSDPCLAAFSFVKD